MAGTEKLHGIPERLPLRIAGDGGGYARLPDGRLDLDRLHWGRLMRSEGVADVLSVILRRAVIRKDLREIGDQPLDWRHLDRDALLVVVEAVMQISTRVISEDDRWERSNAAEVLVTPEHSRLTAQDVSQQTGLSVRTIQVEASANRLIGAQLPNRTWQFTWATVADWLRERHVKGLRTPLGHDDATD
jgi:hypothetical protein